MGDLTKRAGAVVVGVLAADGLIHVYWATGAVWPASDSRALSEAVLGMEASFGPAVVLPLAALLFAAASLVWGRVSLGRDHRLGAVLQAGTLVVAAGLSLRALAGIGWALGIGVEVGSPFYWLNLALYTPLCACLAVAAASAAGVTTRSRLPA